MPPHSCCHCQITSLNIMYPTEIYIVIALCSCLFNSHRRKGVTKNIFYTAFHICLCSHFTVLFLHVDSSSFLVSSILKTPFSISCKASLPTTNSLSFYQSGNALIFSLILLDTEFWVTVFFFQ